MDGGLQGCWAESHCTVKCIAGVLHSTLNEPVQGAGAKPNRSLVLVAATTAPHHTSPTAVARKCHICSESVT